MEVNVEGRALSLTNLDKVLYHETGTTKGEVVDYYARMAPTLLTHLGDRAITMKRYPNGPAGTSFYEKNCPKHRPEWMRTWDITGEDGVISYCRFDSLAAITWAANLAALELHTPMARGTDPDSPTMVVFDLDPGAPAALLDCAEVALWLRHVLADLGLELVVKTSGSKGLQAYLPLNTPTTYGQTAGFSKTVAEALEAAHADRIVSQQRKSMRTGKVLVDWSQNSRHKTTVSVYSLRARDRPTVSTPVTWEEVEAALGANDPALLTFEMGQVLDRLEAHGDLFAPAATLQQRLPLLPFAEAKSTRIVR